MRSATGHSTIQPMIVTRDRMDSPQTARASVIALPEPMRVQERPMALKTPSRRARAPRVAKRKK